MEKTLEDGVMGARELDAMGSGTLEIFDDIFNGLEVTGRRAVLIFCQQGGGRSYIRPGAM